MSDAIIIRLRTTHREGEQEKRTSRNELQKKK